MVPVRHFLVSELHKRMVVNNGGAVGTQFCLTPGGCVWRATEIDTQRGVCGKPHGCPLPETVCGELQT